MDESDQQDRPAELLRRVGGTVTAAQQQVRDAVRAGADALRDADDPELVEVGVSVLAVPGVLALHPGVLGDLAVRLPGRRAPGLSATDDETTVSVVLADNASVRATATAVRDVVVGAVPGAPVRVVVADVRPAPAAPRDR